MKNWVHSEELAEPSVMACPYEHYEVAHREAPVYYSEQLKAFIVTKHADCTRILGVFATYTGDPRLFSEYFLDYSEKYQYLYDEIGSALPVPTLVNLDPPNPHRRYRQLVEKAVSAAPVKRMEEAVEKVAGELLDEFIASGGGDLYRAFCMKFPLYVLVDMYGLPRDYSDIMESAANAMVRLAAAQIETEESIIELHRIQATYVKFVLEYAEKYRKSPQENLLSNLVHAEDENGVRLNDQEIASLSLLLNVGGNETTTNGLGNTLYTMLNNPAIQKRLREHPEEIPQYIEEGLRLITPVNRITRFATKDSIVNGVEIPAGSTLLICLGGANRDEDVFEDAACLTIDRKNVRKHMAFGTGIHFCVGAKLARQELRIGFEQLLKKTKNIAWDTDQPAPVFQPKLLVHGVDRLPVKVE